MGSIQEQPLPLQATTVTTAEAIASKRSKDAIFYLPLAERNTMGHE
jgi:hypothetical protein